MRFNGGLIYSNSKRSLKRDIRIEGINSLKAANISYYKRMYKINKDLK